MAAEASMSCLARRAGRVPWPHREHLFPIKDIGLKQTCSSRDL